MTISSSTAIIPYTQPLAPMEFIKTQVEKGLSNELTSIQQQMLDSILSLSLNLNNLTPTSSESETSLSSFNFEPRSPRCSITELIDMQDRFPINSSISPSKKLNGEEIAEALQAEASFSIATDKKPIVATYGCGPCVALGGYEPINKIAFIVHLSDARELVNSGNLIVDNIKRLVKVKITAPIQLHLRGGNKGQSELIIETIKNWIKQYDLPMEIVSEKILDNSETSLLIDSRTGEVSEYNPKDNPKFREINYLDELSLVTKVNPSIKIVYRP